MDFLNPLVIGIMATLIGSGLIAIIKNKNDLRSTFSEWTRRGIKVIYIVVPRDPETTSLWLYLCGEEKSWLFPNTFDKNRNSYFLAMKRIPYDEQGWQQMYIEPLCDRIKEHPGHLVQLTGESKVLNDEAVIVSDPFRFKDELSECLKKYKVKYCKGTFETCNRWKIECR